MHTFDRRTDIQMALSSLDCIACNACSAMHFGKKYREAQVTDTAVKLMHCTDCINALRN